MRPIIIEKILGIAPRFDPNLPIGWARTAENCDLTSGKIRALYNAALQEADANGYNSLVYHAGAWSRGANAFYCPWKIGDYDCLFYLAGLNELLENGVSSGTPYKKINGVSAPLGQTRLDAPTLASGGAGALSDTFTYFITTTRNVGGFTDESGPSSTATITATSEQITITAPTISDALATYWNIYRMSLSTGEYQFVATVAAATTSYTDNIGDADLGASPTTWYTSDQGNEIIVDEPQTTFSGMIQEPHSGMLFFWKDSSLYWTEPGFPDSCPAFYNMNFPSTIKRVFSYAGVLAVLTASGPFRVDGTHPELLAPSKPLGKEPCIGTASCVTPKGIGYLSDSGLVLFNLFETTVITDGLFTEKWFTDNITALTAFMADNDGKTYLFHSRGVLVIDYRGETILPTTLDILATAASVREDSGDMYYIDSIGIQKLHGGSGSLTWSWDSGYIEAKDAPEVTWAEVEFLGSGTVRASVYLDEVLVLSKDLAWDMVRDRIVKLNLVGKSLDVRLTGTGAIDKIIIRGEA